MKRVATAVEAEKQDDLERRLEQVERSRQWCLKLISKLIHDMSQPLTVLQGEMDLALTSRGSEAEYRRVLGTSLRQIERLILLVQQLRELAELEAPVRLTRGAPLLKCVDDAVETLRPLAQSKGVEFALDAVSECEVGVSEDRLKQAVYGMLHRALDRSPQRSKVLLSVASSQAAAFLRVVDQGPVVALDELAVSLDPFERRRGVRVDLTESGLEWCFARRVAESSGGVFTVKSQPGQGCEVHFAVPLWVVKGRVTG